MRITFSILLSLFFLQYGKLFAQKTNNSKKPLAPEELWIKDSIDLEIKYRKQWIKDSIKWEKANIKRLETFKRIINERWNPKDSLSYVDSKAAVIFKTNSIESLDNLVAVISSNFPNPLHKARVIYYWICINIKYDSASLISNSILYHNNIEKDAKRTFELKTGVCAHYSSLFQYLAQRTGLESIIINGYSKVYPEKYVSAKTDHAWNAVKIKNQWKLIDATWGGNNLGFPETFWFDTPPEKFIYSHFPADSSFQFLKKKISSNQFQTRPIVSSTFFLSKVPVIIPDLGYFTVKDGILLLEAANTKKNFAFKFTAYPAGIDKTTQFSEKENWIPIHYEVRNSSRKGFTIIETKIPGKGSWWIKVDIQENITSDNYKTEITFPRALIFQITSN